MRWFDDAPRGFAVLVIAEEHLSPIRELVARVARLESQLAAANAENARLREENARPQFAVRALAHEVEKLKRRLRSGGRRGGRGTPRPTRPHSGRPRGGQRGHKEHVRTRPEKIDQTQEHSPTACPRCGGDLAPSAKTTERFEFEAVERALHILRRVRHLGWRRCAITGRG